MDAQSAFTAFLKADAMEHRADYLHRGRAYAAMSEQDLKRLLLDTLFRRLVKDSAADLETTRDVVVELAERNVEPTSDQLASLAESCRLRLRMSGEEIPEVVERFGEFLDKLNASKSSN